MPSPLIPREGRENRAGHVAVFSGRIHVHGLPATLKGQKVAEGEPAVVIARQHDDLYRLGTSDHMGDASNTTT
jgi:hypothetical protein